MDFGRAGRFDRLIGKGVAVMHPDGRARKHKIVGLRLRYDREGFHVSGVELELCLTCDVGELVEEGVAFREDDHVYFRPAFLYRNRGECARAPVEERREELLRRRSDELEVMRELMEDYGRHDSRARKMTDELNEIERRCRGSKLFKRRGGRADERA